MPDKQLARVWLFVWLLACLIALGSAPQAHAQEAYTAQDTLDAIQQASDEIGVPYARLYRVVDCETGHTMNPYSVGRQGELGAAQLASFGELPRFYAWGYLDPFSPYQSVRFLAQRIAMGGASAWSCR